MLKIIYLLYCSTLPSLTGLVPNLLDYVLIKSSASWRRVVVLNWPEFFGCQKSKVYLVVLVILFR